MPFAKARWIDNKGRSQEWSGNVASNDRSQIRSEIAAQTGARSVIVNGVSGSSSSDYEECRRRHNEEENERRAAQMERLTSSGQSNRSSSYRPSTQSSSSGSGSSMDPGSAVGLALLIGAGWLFVSFMPWILMLLFGNGTTWLAEKITGQGVEEYTNTENPSDRMHRKALITLVAALMMGGYGFVQGSFWQTELARETNNNGPKPERIIPAQKQ